MIPPSRLRRGMAVLHEVYRALDRWIREGLIEHDRRHIRSAAT
jgi:hypothetical protein